MHVGEISEDRILLRHTTGWMKDGGISKQDFARHHLLPSLQKSLTSIVEPKNANSYSAWFDSRRKMISAMLGGKQQIPLGWKWPWIRALPDPFREECQRELMALNGSFYLPLPAGTEERMPMRSKLASLSKEFSEVIAKSKPAQDGVLDGRDELNESREYAGEILDLIEQGVQELLNIQRGTGAISRRSLMSLLNSHLGNKDC